MAAGRSDGRNARDSPLRARVNARARPREYHHRAAAFRGDRVVGLYRCPGRQLGVLRFVLRETVAFPRLSPPLASCTAARYRISRAFAFARLAPFARDVVGSVSSSRREFITGSSPACPSPSDCSRARARDPCALNRACTVGDTRGCLLIVVEKYRSPRPYWLADSAKIPKGSRTCLGELVLATSLGSEVKYRGF